MRTNNRNYNYLIKYLGIVLISLLLISCEKNNTESVKKDTEEESKSEIQKQIDPINEQLSFNEINNFVNVWCSYQSNDDIQSYLNCYSSEFAGVKRTNSGKEYIYGFSEWAADRSKMYQTAENLSLSAKDLNIKAFSEKDGLTIIEFEQYYISKKYSDHGKKILKLKRDNNGEIKIYYEELLNSIKIGE